MFKSNKIAHICFRLVYPGIQAELRICGGGQGQGAGTAQEGVGQRAGRREDQANKIPHPANGTVVINFRTVFMAEII